MEINSLFGVPAHPLFVHLPVVLTPLAALTAFVMFRERWRKSFLWVTVALSGVALLGAQLAVASGWPLEEGVESEGKALELHANLGEATRTFIAVFFLVTLALAVYELVLARRSNEKPSAPNRRIATVMTAAMVLSGTLATVWVIRTGHQGAEITWKNVGSGSGEGGESGESGE